MTPEALAALTENAKKYARIDYTDDDDLIEIMIEAAVESMADVIPSFDADKMTGRQKIILFTTVKDLYDNRDKYGDQTSGVMKQHLKIAAASMLLSEIYEPKAVQANE